MRGSVLGPAIGTSVAAAVGAATAFVISVVAARALGPAGKGTFDLAVSAAALAVLVLGLSVPTGITYLTARSPRVASGLAASGALLAIGTGLLTGIAVWTAGQLRSATAMTLLPWATGFLAGALLLTAMARAALVGLRRIGTANVWDVAGRVSALALTVAVASTGSSVTLVAASAAGSIVSALGQYYRLGLPSRPDRAEIRATIGFAAPSYASNVIQFLNYRLDLFLVGAFRGPAEVGLYAVATAVAQLLWLIPRAAATTLIPYFAGHDEPERLVSQAAESSRVSMLLGIASAIVLGLLALPFVPLVFGSAFASSADALLLLLPGTALFCPVILLAAFFIGLGRPRLNVIVSGVSLLVTLVGDLLLIPSLGFKGAAAVSSVSYGTSLLVAVWLIHREAGLMPAALLAFGRDDFVRMRQRTAGLLGRGGRP
jgi:O-antigen/teichoic acid export membrane protein